MFRTEYGTAINNTTRLEQGNNSVIVANETSIKRISILEGRKLRTDHTNNTGMNTNTTIAQVFATEKRRDCSPQDLIRSHFSGRSFKSAYANQLADT